MIKKGDILEARQPWRNLAAGILRQAVVDAKNGDPGAWVFIRSTAAIDLCDLANLEVRQALLDFAEELPNLRVGKVARKDNGQWRLVPIGDIHGE